jgi:hypothetical protein
MKYVLSLSAVMRCFSLNKMVYSSGLKNEFFSGIWSLSIAIAPVGHKY